MTTPMRLVGSIVLMAVVILSLVSGCSRRGDLPDLAAIDDVARMKQTFYDFLTPIITAQNTRILAQRAVVAEWRQQLQAGEQLGWWQRRQVRRLAEEYEIAIDEMPVESVVASLWLRVDEIPVDLALAQAAKESAWGRSRFAVEINNLFGQWCYTTGCGVVPARRAAGARHEVEAFDSVTESVRRYMNNLNTHERYQSFRELRASLRSSQQPVTGEAVVVGLLGYSERGADYVNEIQAMIRRNQQLLASEDDA